jgi:hypothetical protein
MVAPPSARVRRETAGAAPVGTPFRVTDEADFEFVAASLRADESDLMSFVEALAQKLEGALPRRVRVVRKPVRFLAKEKRVEEIEIDFGRVHYSLHSNGHDLEARRSKKVRGVAIKSQELALDAWLREFARELSAEAKADERARLALEQLLVG